MATQKEKDYAATLAHDVVRSNKQLFETIAANFALNPSAVNYKTMIQRAKAYQESRNIQREIAEWEITP